MGPKGPCNKKLSVCLSVCLSICLSVCLSVCGDVRPIAIGETLRRLTAKIICLQLKSDLATHFAPLQHGVATPGRSEMLVQHIQMLLESNSELGILKTNISNAFNSVSRQQFLDEVIIHFPQIHAHVQQIYGITSPLLYFNRKYVSVIPSEEGVHQGDPLDSFLFALSIYTSSYQ